MSDAFYVDLLVNAGVEIKIAGTPMRVYQLSIRDQGYLQSIIRAVQPHPFTVFDELSKGKDKTVVDALRADAIKRKEYWPSPVASEEGLRILSGCVEGQRAILKCALHVSEETADKLLDVIGLSDFQKIMATALTGQDPEIAQHPLSPKDEAAESQ